jgi:two-component system LytT family response regulator
MIIHKAVVVKEELINVSVLTKLISNYCLSKEEIIEGIPIESLILELNIVNPDVVFVDVKPLIMEQVISAVSKVVKTMELQQYIDKPSSPINIKNLNITCREYVAISTVDEILFLKMTDIIYCKSDGRYTKFHLENGETYLSSKNIGDYEGRILDNGSFFRIHNSYIINMKYLKRIIKLDGHSCEMENGFVIPVSKRRQEDFNKFIKLK